MLSANEILELKKGVYEVFAELFSSSIQYQAFDLTNTANKYGETLVKKYLDPVTLVGNVKLSAETISEEEAPSKIRPKNISLEIPIYSFELVNVDTSNEEYLSKGRVTYLGTKYSLTSVVPSNMLNDVFLTYKIKGVEIK